MAIEEIKLLKKLDYNKQVDMYVHERDVLNYNTDPLFEDKILNDPLMQRELSIQKGIISYLFKTEALEELDIKICWIFSIMTIKAILIYDKDLTTFRKVVKSHLDYLSSLIRPFICSANSGVTESP
jgi:hypothetical protein